MIEPSTAPAPVKTSSDRSFGLVFAAVFALVALYPVLHGNAWRPWALVVAALFLGVAYARPALLAPLNRVWTMLGGLMHKVMAPLIMGVVFFAVFVPMGLVMRLLGKRPLKLRYGNETSYWVTREPRTPDFFNNQF